MTERFFERREKHSGPFENILTCVRKGQEYRNGVPYGGLINYASAPYLVGKEEFWTVGFNVDHFHARLKRGELIPHTPFWQFYQKGSTEAVYNLRYWAGTTRYTDFWVQSGVFAYFSDWIVSYNDLAAILPPMDNYYVQKAAAAIYGEGHDTLTFLAELTSVGKLFTATAKTFAKAIDRYQKLSKRLPLSKKAIAGEWLSARYGWRTLLYDIDDLSRVIAEFDLQRRTRYSKTRSQKATKTVVTERETSMAPTVFQHTIVDEIETGQRGSVIADIEVPQFQFNPLQTGWELIPLSFVLDWFIGVGQAIAAAAFHDIVNQYSASTGQYVKVVRSYTGHYVPYTVMPNAITGTWDQTGTCEAWIERRIPCDVPLSPQYKLRLNPLKIVDLVGLLVQRKKGIGNKLWQE